MPGTYERWSKTRMADVVVDPKVRPDAIKQYWFMLLQHLGSVGCYRVGRTFGSTTTLAIRVLDHRSSVPGMTLLTRLRAHVGSGVRRGGGGDAGLLDRVARRRA